MKELWNKIKNIKLKKINTSNVLNIVSYIALWIIGIFAAIVGLAFLSIIMMGL